MKLQLATIDDLESIMTFYHDVIVGTPRIFEEVLWEEPYHPSLEEVKNYIQDKCFYLWLDDQTIIGAFALPFQQADYHSYPFSLSLPDHLVGVVHILAIHPSFVRQGQGKKMINALFQQAKTNQLQSIRLDAIHTNTKAITLYEKMGFKLVTSAINTIPGLGGFQFDIYEYNL